MLDFFAEAPLRAEAVEGLLPGDVSGEVGGGAPRAEDEVLVGCAFGD